jgi:hypothetical protein
MDIAVVDSDSAEVLLLANDGAAVPAFTATTIATGGAAGVRPGRILVGSFDLQGMCGQDSSGWGGRKEYAHTPALPAQPKPPSRSQHQPLRPPPPHMGSPRRCSPCLGASATTLDFAVLDAGGGVVIILSSQGSGQPYTSTTVATSLPSTQVADVIDVDGDGDSDLVTATQNGLAPNVIVLLVNGGGAWTTQTLLSQAGSIFSSLKFMDITGEGAALGKGEGGVYPADGRGKGDAHGDGGAMRHWGNVGRKWGCAHGAGGTQGRTHGEGGMRVRGGRQ